jgi:disulfide bond formation protein DsbB
MGLLAAITASLLVSAYVLEVYFNAIPCPMCLWQRQAHILILGLAIAGLGARFRPYFAGAIGVVALAGMAIASWQFAAQNQWLPFPPSCTSLGQAALAEANQLLTNMGTTRVVPCDKETFHILGLSLAGWNIPAMALCVAIAGRILYQSKGRH